MAGTEIFGIEEIRVLTDVIERKNDTQVRFSLSEERYIPC